MDQKPDNTVTLEKPIKRGEKEITSITLNKPNSGGLRGCSLRGLLDFQTDDIIKVLPRVTEPALTDAEAARLEPVDLLKLGAVIAGFLLPKQVMEEAGLDSQPA